MNKISCSVKHGNYDNDSPQYHRIQYHGDEIKRANQRIYNPIKNDLQNSCSSRKKLYSERI